MKCREFQDAVLDCGDLGSGRLREHAASCSACRALLAAVSALAQEGERARQEDISPVAAAGTRALAMEALRTRSTLRFPGAAAATWGWAAAAAAAAALVAGVWLHWESEADGRAPSGAPAGVARADRSPDVSALDGDIQACQRRLFVSLARARRHLERGEDSSSCEQRIQRLRNQIGSHAAAWLEDGTAGDG